MTQEPSNAAVQQVKGNEPGLIAPPAAEGISHSRSWTSRLPVIVAALAVIIGTGLIATTYPVFNQTTDEAQHFAAGLEWLDLGTYNYETLTPPLGRAATAVGPYLAGTRCQGDPNVWAEGNILLAYQGHYQRTLTLARLGTLPFFWLACFVIWRFAARTYEPWLATLAVVLFAFCPLVLAHAGLATVDMAVTAMFLCALVCFWSFLQEPKASSAALAAFTAGLAVLCKLSAVPYLGVSCTALYVYSAIKTKRIPPWKYIGVGALTMVLTIWAGYRFSVGPILQKARLTPLMTARLQQMPPSLAKAITSVPVPAPSFFLGVLRAFELNKGVEYGYLLGQVYQGGRWDFFPVGIAVKTPIPFLLLAILGVILVAIRRARNAVLLLVGVAGPLLIAMSSNENIGLRYALPVYPFLAILAAYAGLWLWRAGTSAATSYACRAIVVILVLWNVVGTVHAAPDFIPYFNEVAAPYSSRILVDSDFDWGQDLKRLAAVLKERNIGFFWVAYEGTADLKLQDMPPSRMLQSNQKPAGWIAISEFKLKTDADQFGWLENYQPVCRAGKTIRLYHFDTAPAN
jgi:4-amino-4-deoxy-L-arabinose transferase-like glycosyltransferase